MQWLGFACCPVTCCSATCCCRWGGCCLKRLCTSTYRGLVQCQAAIPLKQQLSHCALKPLWRQADKHALPVFEVWVFVKSSGPLGDGEYLAGCRFHGCFCCSVPCSPLARAAGTPAVHWAVSRWLWPLCTNLPGLPPFVWEHEKCLWQCCCQGLRSVQLQILAAYLLHLSRALKHSLLELLYSLSSPTAYLVALG